MAQQQRPSRGPMDYSEVQEHFSDVFEINLNPWSAVLNFGLRSVKDDQSSKMELRVRMPLQQAKALGVLLLRTIRGYEQQTQTDIDLPKQILDSLGIAPEDWVRFRGA